MTPFTRASTMALLALLVLVAWAPARAETVLDYEGRLEARGLPAQGAFDFSFRLFDRRDPESGDPIGEEIVLTGVPVRDGRFEVELVFEADVPEAWLEVAVAHSNRFGDFEVLEPRQRVESGTKASDVTTGMVTFFNLPACPSGWSAYEPAQGRALVGLNPLGTLVGQVGTALGDLEERQHHHPYGGALGTSFSGDHSHIWAKMTSGWVWKSYNSAGTEITVKDWGNGVGNEGSGHYPLAVNQNQSLYTRADASHQHTVGATATEEASTSPTLPFVQLLACIKD